jgi:hypothetical protein
MNRRCMNRDLVAELPHDISLLVFSYFDVWALLLTKWVCRSWCSICTKAIDYKRGPFFRTLGELKRAVARYYSLHSAKTVVPSADLEWVASTYGYVINKWDVSHVVDFSCLFEGLFDFNEDISLWDVGCAEDMSFMF